MLDCDKKKKTALEARQQDNRELKPCGTLPAKENKPTSPASGSGKEAQKASVHPSLKLGPSEASSQKGQRPHDQVYCYHGQGQSPAQKLYKAGRGGCEWYSHHLSGHAGQGGWGIKMNPYELLPSS